MPLLAGGDVRGVLFKGLPIVYGRLCIISSLQCYLKYVYNRDPAIPVAILMAANRLVSEAMPVPARSYAVP